MTIRSPNPHTPPQRSNAAAFTLIEVLLALSLSALLIGAIYWALAAGFDAHRQADRVVRTPRAAELALETLRADLRGAVRPSGRLAAEFTSYDRSAEAGRSTHRLVLYTTAGGVGEPSAPGLRRVEWLIDFPADDPRAQRPALLRRVTDNLLAPVVPEPNERVVLPDVLDLTFRFYDGSQWEAKWDSAERGDSLPAAAEVSFAIYEPDMPQPANLNAREDELVYRVTRVIAIPTAERNLEGGITR